MTLMNDCKTFLLWTVYAVILSIFYAYSLFYAMIATAFLGVFGIISFFLWPITWPFTTCSWNTPPTRNEMVLFRIFEPSVLSIPPNYILLANDEDEMTNVSSEYGGMWENVGFDSNQLEEDLVDVLKHCGYASNDNRTYDEVLMASFRDGRYSQEAAKAARILLKYRSKYAHLTMKEMKEFAQQQQQ